MRAAASRSQAGVSLLEALFSLLVLAAGTLGIARVHLHLEAHADIARQRSEAVRLAQEALETARSPDAAQATSGTHTVEAIAGHRFNTTFALAQQVDAAGAGPTSASVAVTWKTRDGSTQQAVLASTITAQDPALSGALTLLPSARAAAGRNGLAGGLPAGLRILDERRSAFKPTANATIAFVVDTASGQVTAQCSGVPAEVSTEALRAEHLTHCVEFKALLLSGVVRFSNASPPDAASANDAPLDLALSIGPPGMMAAASPWCFAQAQKTVTYRTLDGVHREAVAIDAQAAGRGVTDWQDTGERFTAYRCVVVAAGDPPRWSARSDLVPLGWSIGSAPQQRRVCRYVNDLDGSGSIDRNDEHPDVYRGVDKPLLQQNFLVVRGDLACPAQAGPTIGAEAPADAIVTAPHQP